MARTQIPEDIFPVFFHVIYISALHGRSEMFSHLVRKLLSRSMSVRPWRVEIWIIRKNGENIFRESGYSPFKSRAKYRRRENHINYEHPGIQYAKQ